MSFKVLFCLLIAIYCSCAKNEIVESEKEILNSEKQNNSDFLPLNPEVVNIETQNGGFHDIHMKSDLLSNESDTNIRVQKSAQYQYEELIETLKNVDPHISVKLGDEGRSSDKLMILRRDKYGSQIIEDPLYSEVMKSVPSPDQRSLVIIFDGTGSMVNDLAQLTKGAETIITEVTQRQSNPIYNYIFVPFRDPYIGPKLVTQNLTKFLEEIKKLPLLGGGDCPESAVGGINLALESALPKSFVFVFTDATARDFGLDGYTVDLIQEKQVTLTFLLTGFCKSKDSEGYKVFEKLATLSNGQIYNLQKTDIAEVLDGIKASLDADLVPINYLYSNTPGSQSIDVPVDENLKELTVSVAGERPNITVKNPEEVEHTNISEILNLNNLKIINIHDPQPGKWNVKTEADSEHFIKLTGISDLKFNFGFSAKDPSHIKETSLNPTLLLKNVLSVTPSNNSLVYNLTSVELALQNVRPGMIRNITLPLHRTAKQELPEHPTIYSTIPFEPPLSMFKLYVNGYDSRGNPLKQLLSTALRAIPEETPRIIAINSFVDILQGQDAYLECRVLSSSPTKVSWIRNNTIIEQSEYEVNNIYRLHLENVQLKDAGEYMCSTQNSNGVDEKVINLIVNKKINPISVKLTESNMTATENDVDYQISCFVYPSQNVTYSWLFNGEDIGINTAIDIENENIVLRNISRYNTGNYTCIATNDDLSANDTGYLSVLYEPAILNANSENSSVTYGSDLQLDCNAIGNPTPVIEWIAPDDVSNFNKGFIQGFSNENEGIYSCKVSNGVGSVAVKQFTLQSKAKDPPRLRSIEPRISIRVGSELNISCQCEMCNPIIEYFWKKSTTTEFHDFERLEGNIIDKNEDYTKLSEFNLYVPSSTINDNGYYACHIENEHGYDEKIIDVRIFEPSAVKNVYGIYRDEKVYDVIKVIEGESFAFQCEVEGHPTPIIQWVKHGVEITEHKIISKDNSTLELNKVTPYDRGTYGCIARNPYGHNYKEIKVQVVVPPKLRSPEEAVVMVESGNEVVIECDVVGDPLPNIIWKFYTSNLLPSYTNQQNNNYLNFTAAPEDAGVYECIAENEAGKAMKSTVLVVAFEPKIFPKNDTVVAASIGEEISLACRAEGHPEPQILWRFNGSILKNLQHVVLESSGDLVLKNVDISMTGTYTCEASNNMGTAQRTISLEINYPPKILSKLPTTFKLLPNFALSFECKAEGSPTPLIFWTRNGTTISQNEPTSHILQLYSSGQSQTGDYVCRAVNSEGADEVKVEIISVEKPYVIKELLSNEPHNVTEGDTIRLVCPLREANNFTWYYKKNAIKGKHSQEIEITAATPEHAGRYTCIGENEAGIQNFTQELLVWSPPDIIAHSIENNVDDNVISIREGENITLKCLAAGYPKPQIQWEKDLAILSTNPELHLTNLKFYHAGVYTCKANNIFGVDSMSYKIDVLIPPTPQLSKNNWKEVFEGDDIELDCEPYGNPPPTVRWMKDGEELGIENSILEIFAAEKDDSGTYVCKLHNSLGNEEILFHIDILAPPRFISYPKDTIIDSNELMELSCTAEGNPSPILAWGLNSKTILSSASALSIQDKNVTNEEIIIDEFGNTFNYRGAEFSRDKNIWQNLIKPKGIFGRITKMKNTVTLTLIIDDPKMKKSGTYVCYAINSLGSEEQKYSVDVFAPPYLNGRNIDKEKFVNKTLLEGLPLILSCLWNGNPSPEISWFQYHKFLNERPGYRLSRNNKTLTVLYANESHSGLYTCVATNSAGEDRRQFLVDILVPPKIKNIGRTEIIPHTHTSGQTTTLECPAVGNPKPSIFWSKHLSGNSNSMEILSETSNQLVLDELEESGVYSCYVNNSLGSVQKQFSIEVLKIPHILDKWPSQQKIKEYQTIALHCRAKATPKPTIRWYKDGIEINGRFPNVQFSDDNTIMKIPNARKRDSGVYICIAQNKMGEIQRNINITVIRDAIWSDWEPWTPCSSSCGLGVKTRKRRCIVNGVFTNDDNSCSGANYESERCEMLPCPIDGGWSEWSKWTSCSMSCMNNRDQENPTRKRYRNCNTPKPANGGKNCLGYDYEEENCNTHLCPIDGGWSNWTQWSSCSVLCGIGIKERYRECNKPYPSFGGKPCSGLSKRVAQCYATSCPVNGGWSDWSPWSECSRTCGEGVRKRTRICSNPVPNYGGKDCAGPNVEILKCQKQSCKHLNYEENKNWPLTPESMYEAPDLHFFVESDEVKIDDYSDKFQYASGSKSKVISKEYMSGDYYDDIDENDHGIKVVVTYQNYRPIDPDIKQITFFPDKNPYRVERIIPCQVGFELDSNGKCSDINECEREGFCKEDEICTNFIGSFKCSCYNGFIYDDKSKKCEDIDECSLKTKHGCSHSCKNTFGGYFCMCPKGYSLGPNEKTCQPNFSGFNGQMMSDHAIDADFTNDSECPEGYEKVDKFCQDIDECLSFDHDCGVDQSCLNTKGSYLCIPTPCIDNYERDEQSGQCVQMCETEEDTGKSTCNDGAKISQSISYTLLSLEDFDHSEAFLKIVNYGINRKALPETLFTIEPGKHSTFFKLETLAFKKGISYLYAVNKIKREKLYNIKVKAKSFDPKTFELLYVTKFVIFLYIL